MDEALWKRRESQKIIWVGVIQRRERDCLNLHEQALRSIIRDVVTRDVAERIVENNPVQTIVNLLLHHISIFAYSEEETTPLERRRSFLITKDIFGRIDQAKQTQKNAQSSSAAAIEPFALASASARALLSDSNATNVSTQTVASVPDAATNAGAQGIISAASAVGNRSQQQHLNPLSSKRGHHNVNGGEGPQNTANSRELLENASGDRRVKQKAQTVSASYAAVEEQNNEPGLGVEQDDAQDASLKIINMALLRENQELKARLLAVTGAARPSSHEPNNNEQANEDDGGQTLETVSDQPRDEGAEENARLSLKRRSQTMISREVPRNPTRETTDRDETESERDDNTKHSNDDDSGSFANDDHDEDENEEPDHEDPVAGSFSDSNVRPKSMDGGPQKQARKTCNDDNAEDDGQTLGTPSDLPHDEGTEANARAPLKRRSQTANSREAPQNPTGETIDHDETEIERDDNTNSSNDDDGGSFTNNDHDDDDENKETENEDPVAGNSSGRGTANTASAATNPNGVAQQPDPAAGNSSRRDAANPAPAANNPNDVVQQPVGQEDTRPSQSNRPGPGRPGAKMTEFECFCGCKSMYQSSTAFYRQHLSNDKGEILWSTFDVGAFESKLKRKENFFTASLVPIRRHLIAEKLYFQYPGLWFDSAVLEQRRAKLDESSKSMLDLQKSIEDRAREFEDDRAKYIQKLKDLVSGEMRAEILEAGYAK